MKRQKNLIYLLLLICLMCGCAENIADSKWWNLSLVMPKGHEDLFVTCNTKIETETGELYFQNENDFPLMINVYSIMDEKTAFLEYVKTFEPGECAGFKQTQSGKPLEINVYADVKEGTYIKLMAYEDAIQ